jgi:hypothetical protein
MDEDRLDDDAMLALAERLESLPLEHADWVVALFQECQRARAAEAAALAAGGNARPDADFAQTVLDTADWLRTLWEVGYLGGEAFPAPPRSEFPQISVEDILKSALFARIREGKRPLPFPPPTRHGNPWHEVVESEQAFTVDATLADGDGAIIEGCADWRVVDREAAGTSCRVQHRGKGPLYRLQLAGAGSTLQKWPAERMRRIVRQSRAGIDAYLLEWPGENGAQRFPLRATSWERAEDEAQRWIALRHPQLYGQVRFERSED